LAGILEFLFDPLDQLLVGPLGLASHLESLLPVLDRRFLLLELFAAIAEVFEARAFGKSLAEGGEVHFLVHHDFDRPLASRSAGSLDVKDDDEALVFEARLSPGMGGVGYVRDFLGTLESGLVGGISPGFQIPEGGETVTRDADGLLRTVRAANLVEISAVTRPAYPASQIEARNWQPENPQMQVVGAHPLNRWRL